jgi:hypothetical protein
MKFLNLKNVLILSGFLWVGISFYWFSKNETQEALNKMADMSISYANSDWLQRSKDLRFKLGQWSYNYHLVKTKGLDFDQEGFLKSEFENIYFFKFEDDGFKTQWVKSKDMASAVVPKSIGSKLKFWTKDQVLEKEFIYFSEKNGGQASKVYFGFPIVDDFMGEGLILSSLDLDYVQLLNPSLGVYVLDSKGKFLFHPKKEYIGQAGDRWVQSKKESNVFFKSELAKGIDGEFIFSQKIEGIAAQTLMPTIVMFLGLCLIFGVLIFEIYMLSPLALKNEINISDLDSSKSDFNKEDYGSLLKLNEVRESLNKMSLLSSVIKGRLDLAANGELDSRLFEDIKMDFETLDQNLESTYRSSQVYDQELATSTAIDDQPPQSDVVTKPVVSDTSMDNKGGAPIQSLQNAAQIMREQGFGDGNAEDVEDHLGFENQVEFEDINFDDAGITFSDATDEVVGEGVVFQEYIGTDSETNDWAKIIEELTEEINTVEIKPTDFRTTDVSSPSESQITNKDFI